MQVSFKLKKKEKEFIYRKLDLFQNFSEGYSSLNLIYASPPETTTDITNGFVRNRWSVSLTEVANLAQIFSFTWWINTLLRLVSSSRRIYRQQQQRIFFHFVKERKIIILNKQAWLALQVWLELFHWFWKVYIKKKGIDNF